MKTNFSQCVAYLFKNFDWNWNKQIKELVQNNFIISRGGCHFFVSMYVCCVRAVVERLRHEKNQTYGKYDNY
jgi:hypothetical protein